MEDIADRGSYGYASEDEDEAESTRGGEEETRRSGGVEDLAVVLSGKSPEFWRGLWAGWNGAGLGSEMSPGVGGEGVGEGKRV